MVKSDFDEYVLANMPHFIALNYQQLLEVQSSQDRVRLALHIYDLGLRALTISMVSQYLIRDKDRVFDPYLNDLLLQKFPHLTLDAWQQLFFASLRAYEGQRDLFFMPELYDFYWDTATLPHQRRTEVEPTFERLTQIATEAKTKQLLPQDEAGWDKLANETTSLLQQILHSFAFIDNYDLIRVVGCSELFYDFELHKGLHISTGRQPVPQHAQLGPGWFYLRKGTEDFLLLHPLLVFWEREPGGGELVLTDTGVYDRFIYERLQYLLAALGKTIVDDKSVKAFVTLLYETIEEAKRKRQEADRLNWWQLRDMCMDITRQRMATVQHKYRRELYLQREKTRKAFEKYLGSGSRCFVLIGKSGVGKSNFFLALGDEVHQSKSDVSVLMYDGAHLKVEPSITTSISQDFDERLVLAGQRVQDVWREIAKIDGIDQRRVVLCVDAINENPQAKELLRQLDELVQSPWPWLKVVFSSRPETWQTIKRGVKLAEALYYQEEGSETLGVELEPFSYSEQMEPFSRQELPEAYARYQQVFNLQTPYEVVRSELRETLRDPLNLWLVAKTCEGQTIPDTLKVTELIEQYVKALLKSGRLQEQDLRLLEKQLVPLMVREGHYSNVITIADIDAARGELYEALYSEQVLSDGRRLNQPFTNLLDADILVRQEEGREQKIAFKYERFYEYFIGKRLMELSETQANRLTFFLDIVGQTAEVPFLWGAVKNALVMETKEHGSDMVLKLCFTEQQRIKEMLVVALTEFGRGDAARAEQVLTTLLEAASDQERSAGVLKLFRGKGSDTRLVNAKKIAAEVASNLGVCSILVSLARDPSPKVRAHTIRYSYYLWNKDRGKGYAILDLAGSQVLNRFRLPNAKALEFCVNLALLVFLDHYDEPEVTRRLQELLRPMLKKVLYIGTAPFGLKGLERLGREIVLQAGIGLVTRITSTAPRFFPANLHEIECFFHLPGADKERFMRLVGYLDPDVGDFQAIVEDITRMAENDDALATFVMTHVVLAQWHNNKDKLLSVLENIYKGGIERGVSGAAPQATVSVYWACLHDKERGIANDKAAQLLAKFEEGLVMRGQRVHHYRSGREYVNPIQCVTLSTLNKYKDFRDTPIAQYVKLAIEEEDVQFARDLLWLLGEIATISKQSSLALSACAPLLSFKDPLVQDELVASLARIRQYYPYAVDDFLAEHGASESFVQRVLAAETNEQEDVIFSRATPFFYIGLPNSPYLRRELANLLRRVAKCRSINEAIIVVIKRLITELYGEDIFAKS